MNSWRPHDDAMSERQTKAVKQMAAGLCVLDLGSGDGRVAAMASTESKQWVGVDHDPVAVQAFQARVPDATCRSGDLRMPPTAEHEQFDLVVCLGNTFCLLWDVDEAVEALLNWRGLLAEGGCVVLDDLAADLWPELTSGRWSIGMDDEASLQMVWSEDDAVFALRAGSQINPTQWHLGSEDVRMRLWTSGALSLAARLAGYMSPERRPDEGLMILRPVPSAGANTSA